MDASVDGTDGEILRRPLEIYSPFDGDQIRLLRSFVDAVRELTTYSFFEQVPNRVRLFGVSSAESPAMHEPRSELTRATAVLFRQLYKPSEEASFAKVMRLLRASVHNQDNPNRNAAMAALRDIVTWHRDILKCGAGIQMIYSDGERQCELRVATLLNEYLNGVWVHRNNEKTARAEARDASSPLPRYTAYRVILRLTNVYFVTANIVDLVLAEPALTGNT